MTESRRPWVRFAAPVTVLALTAGLVTACSSDTSTSTTSASATAESEDRGGGGGMMQSITEVELNTDGENGENANTEEVAAAADAFLAALTGDQLETATYEFSDNLSRQTWSNFPASTVPRMGIALSDLDEDAQAAALAVAESMLSEDGYTLVGAIRSADDWLSTNSAEGSGSTFGNGNYYLAIYGTPSTTEPFMVQFGGHHLARNFTYNGTTASITPAFTGTEPKSFTLDGEEYAPMKQKAETAFAVLDSLTKEQLAEAELSEKLDDIVMGPGMDGGEFPTSGGVLVSDLTAQQQQLVLDAISAWVGDADAGVAESLLKTYEEGFGETRFSFANSAEVDGEGTYLRIDGPRVWIEVINAMSRSTSEVHYHGVYRDKADDYGSTSPAS